MTTEPTQWQEIGPRFDGKVCIVTGGARGIGAAIVAALAQLGAKVGIADRDGAEEAAAALRAAGYDAIGIATDISYTASASAMVEAVRAKWGRVDVLVNNAGLATGLKPRPFEQIEDEEWFRVYQVNVFGTMRCAKAVSALMRAGGGGRIVNIASASALKGVPNLLHYVSSKGAVIAMTKALARELGGDGILVNAVAPGFTLSEATVENQEQMAQTRTVALQGRVIPRDQMPDDVVGAVLFLAGAGASFISGQTLVVDGGTYLH